MSRSLAFLLMALLVTTTATVVAHMKASKTEPAANATLTASPSRVQIWFTQAPDAKVSKLDLAGPTGAVKLAGFRVTSEKSMVAQVEGDLAEGRYTLRWQSAGNDGHIQKGEFSFTVKRSR